MVFPARPPVQLLSINWGTMKGYPISTLLTPVQVGKESSGRFQDLESWVGHRASPVGLEAGRDLQVTGIRREANPLK